MEGPEQQMRKQTDSLKMLFSYGEVVGFGLAWLIGLAMLHHTQSPQPRLAGVEGLANAEVGMSDINPDDFK